MLQVNQCINSPTQCLLGQTTITKCQSEIRLQCNSLAKTKNCLGISSLAIECKTKIVKCIWITMAQPDSLFEIRLRLCKTIYTTISHSTFCKCFGLRGVDCYRLVIIPNGKIDIL